MLLDKGFQLIVKYLQLHSTITILLINKKGHSLDFATFA